MLWDKVLFDRKGREKKSVNQSLLYFTGFAINYNARVIIQETVIKMDLSRSVSDGDIEGNLKDQEQGFLRCKNDV